MISVMAKPRSYTDAQPRLTPRQAAFVAEYVKDGNATQAAIRAGYSESTAKQQGSRLLTHVDVSAALVAAHATAVQVVAERTDQAVITAASVAERAWEIANYRPNGPAVMALALLAKQYPEFSEKHEVEARVGVMLVRQTRSLAGGR